MAGAHDVFPSRGAPLGAGNYVVQVKIGSRQPASTILAGTIVAGVNVIAAEAHLALGNAIVADKQDDPRYTDDPVHQTNGFVGG